MLAARLGGTRASFEAKYGKPVDGATTNRPTAVYRLKNVGRFAVLFQGERVVGITAIADRLDHLPLTESDDRDWGVSAATRRAKAFLPADAACDPQPVKSAGAITTSCHSRALAAAIPASSVRVLGIFGDAGDCAFVLNADASGRVSTISVVLGRPADAGTGTPSPHRPVQVFNAGTPTAAAKSDALAAIKHCADFASQAEAQAYFDAHGGDTSPVVRGLDRDRDGKACEGLK